MIAKNSEETLSTPLGLCQKLPATIVAIIQLLKSFLNAEVQVTLIHIQSIGKVEEQVK